MLSFHGAWRITVVSKSADFDQRVVVRTDYGDRVLPGRPGATLEVDLECWRLSLEHLLWGRSWQPNLRTVPGPVTEQNGLRSRLLTSNDCQWPGKPWTTRTWWCGWTRWWRRRLRRPPHRCRRRPGASGRRQPPTTALALPTAGQRPPRTASRPPTHRRAAACRPRRRPPVRWRPGSVRLSSRASSGGPVSSSTVIIKPGTSSDRERTAQGQSHQCRPEGNRPSHRRAKPITRPAQPRFRRAAAPPSRPGDYPQPRPSTRPDRIRPGAR